MKNNFNTTGWSRYAARGVIAIALFLLTLNKSESSNKELEQEIIQSMSWFDNYVSDSQRAEMAVAISKYWEHFDSRVPKLAPAEKSWLEGELGVDGIRLDRAMNSREFALYWLELHIIRCRDDIGSLLQSQKNESYSDFEMYNWVRLIYCYAEMDNVRIYLERAGLSDGRWDGPFFLRGSTIIRDRIINAVAFSAMVDTMGWTIKND